MISESETIRLKGGAEVSVDWSTRTNCKLCKREIYWTKTRYGKMMPINVITPKFEGDMVEWESHFASCPNAQNFRKLTEEQEEIVEGFRKKFREHHPEIELERFKVLAKFAETFWISKMIQQKGELKARYKAGLRNLSELVENKTKKELTKKIMGGIEEYKKRVRGSTETKNGIQKAVASGTLALLDDMVKTFKRLLKPHEENNK